MKHIIRKPLLPILLVLILLFGSCFMTLFQKGIEDDKHQVENLYQNTKLIFQILPGENATTALRLDTYTGSKILALDLVEESYTRMECLYSLRQPEAFPGVGIVYGTNNPSWLATDFGLQIHYLENWDDERFLTDSSLGIPCIVSTETAETCSSELVIAGAEAEGEDNPKAPDLQLIIVGTYTDPAGKLGQGGLIVPEGIFLAKPGLLFNSNMMFNCFYRGFAFELNNAYNKQHKQVTEEIEDILGDPGKFTVYSNARILDQAIRPIERRLQIQQMLILPLGILFCIAVSILAILTAISFRTEIFLRFMWGEKRWKVFFKMLLSVLAIEFICGCILVPALFVFAGKAWIVWGLRYFAMCIGASILCSAVVLMRCCTENLVKLYQTREG